MNRQNAVATIAGLTTFFLCALVGIQLVTSVSPNALTPDDSSSSSSNGGNGTYHPTAEPTSAPAPQNSTANTIFIPTVGLASVFLSVTLSMRAGKELTSSQFCHAALSGAAFATSLMLLSGGSLAAAILGKHNAPGWESLLAIALGLLGGLIFGAAGNVLLKSSRQGLLRPAADHTTTEPLFLNPTYR